MSLFNKIEVMAQYFGGAQVLTREEALAKANLELQSIRTNPKPSNFISFPVMKEYLSGMTHEEMDRVEAEFNDYCPNVSPNRTSYYFVQFMEEVYNHTFCDVCCASYPDDDPCGFH